VRSTVACIGSHCKQVESTSALQANEIIQQLHALLLEERQRRKLEVQEEKERRKFAAEVLLGIKAGNRTFLESDAMKALENKMGHLRLPTS